ncbi:MAG: hypothetical protein WKG06_36170 [Segetibacter sp.]
MKTTKKMIHVVALAMIAATLMFTASCKKHPLESVFSSPWKLRSSGINEPQRAIIEMSEPDQITCYGLLTDGKFTPTHDITITHDGGTTWHSQTIAALENNYDFGVAASDAGTVHVMGWNYKKGGGNIFRSVDGGITWQREAANAYTDAASFPDAIKFFDPENGVLFGDPLNGYYEIYTTSDGGNNWSRVPSANIPAPLANEYGIPYNTDTYKNTIWTLATVTDSTGNPVSGQLLQSDDRGFTWYVRNPSMTLKGGAGSLKFCNSSVGLFKNNAILYRTTDGGTTWNVVNYSGKWLSFDLDNIPGLNGAWISTGGGPAGNINASGGIGSSISYDDGDHWTILDTLNHTCVDMTSPVHGYSGGITTGSGNDGVFIYQPLHAHLPFE